ncbi:hypothetical protein AUR64_18455 [Haloprofundus marisrubri]|uniref:Uncharacterized protein n=1 Tax=Haloprofundus marisrubri TaxID=1514971 RepID=A0A0W1R5J8_9EURY|nr:hypothetical protein [Haloprofundus marisrubri]KTG08648.1 hypothetical protein AUR64_18455 [Haloprofundus marisrubri]
MVQEATSLTDSLTSDAELPSESAQVELENRHATWDSSVKAEMFGFGFVVGLLLGSLLGLALAALFPAFSGQALIFGIGLGAGAGVLAGVALKEYGERNTVRTA